MGSADEVMARVRQLPEILGKSDSELADKCGVTPQQWSNYKAEGAHNNELPWRCALTLWDAYGIPMEWLYDGQTTRTPDPQMREKLALAERRARAWLTRPRGGRSKSRMAHILAVVAAGALLLAGQSNAGHAWKRIDGAIAENRLQANRLICKTETYRDNTAPPGLVYQACMANHGYLPND